MIIVCHLGEASLKGKNRVSFETRLVSNIAEMLSRKGIFIQNHTIRREFGRILIPCDSYEQCSAIFPLIRNIFGIANFFVAEESQRDIDKMCHAAWSALSKKPFATFKINAKRGDKKFPLTSNEVNSKIGAFILKMKPTVQVQLRNPEITCEIEITERAVYVGTEKRQGAGGMPVGSSARAIVLLSGGYDSPVASWYALKRGIDPIFVHFHSLPYTNRHSVEKVKRIVKVMRLFGASGQLVIVPLTAIQQRIVTASPEKLRVILYRRAMMRLAGRIAEEFGAKAIVTGDSIGQVASQTLENMAAIDDASPLPTLRPLAGFDKTEIINLARIIGTHDISAEPHEDCCSRFMPKKPETKSRITSVRAVEKNIDFEHLFLQALAEQERITVL